MPPTNTFSSSPETRPSETNTEPPLAVIGGPVYPLPEPSSPKKPRNKLKIILIAAIVITLCCSSVALIFMRKSKDSSSTNISTRETENKAASGSKTASELISTIESQIDKLNYTEITLPKSDSPNRYIEKPSGPFSLSIYADFYGSYVEYKEDKDIASPIREILGNNGLNQDKEDEIYYRNNLISCMLLKSRYVTQVACVKNDTLLRLADSLEPIIDKTRQIAGVELYGPISVDYAFSEKDNQAVTIVTANKAQGKSDMLNPVYMTSSDTKNWKFVAQAKDSLGNMPPDCTLFSPSEIMLFKKNGLEC